MRAELTIGPVLGVGALVGMIAMVAPLWVVVGTILLVLTLALF